MVKKRKKSSIKDKLSAVPIAAAVNLGGLLAGQEYVEQAIEVLQDQPMLIEGAAYLGAAAALAYLNKKVIYR